MYQNKAIEIFYLFFQGALCFQLLVFFILYIITRRKYLLLYSLFLLLAAAHFFINAPATFFNIPEDVAWESQWYNLLNEPVIILMNFFYLLFLRSFYADVPQNANTKKLFIVTTWIVPVLFILFIIFTIANVNRDIIFFGVNIISVLPAITIITYAFKFKFPFSRLLLYGLICYVSGTLLTMLMNLLRNMEVKHLLTFGYPLLFIRLGVLGDMFFLLLVILKKWHLQEKQLAVEKISAQLNVEKLRNRLSMELHDDLGATLSGISMYGHLARKQLQNGHFEGVQNSLTVIQDSATEMVNKLNDIVWFTNPAQDGLSELIQYMEEYAIKMAATKNMSVKVHITEAIEQQQLTMEQRRNVYLFCKEAINNAVKYSEGSLLELSIRKDGHLLEFSVKDNGIGFDPKNIKRGNGLNNLQQRAGEIGATFFIQAAKGEGCTVSLHLKIT